MPIKWEEKRRFPRVTLKTAAVRCQIRGSAEFNNAATNDIGLGGIAFTSEKFIAPNTWVNLEVNLVSRIITPIGRIARVNFLPHFDRYLLGIEFQELEPEQKKYLADFINMRLQ